MSTRLNNTEVNELRSIVQERGLFIRLDETDDSYSDFNKVNFVDSNNRLVGFELAQNCCETAYWHVELNDGDKTNTIDYESEYIQRSATKVKHEFCDEFTKVISKCWFCSNVYFDDKEPIIKEDEEGGGTATWDLVNDKGECIGKLVLENCHNGYYSHGFYDVRDGQEPAYNSI